MLKYCSKSALILISCIFLFNLVGLKHTLAQENYEGIVFANHKALPGYGFKKARHPEMFQGNNKKKNYFEGWYFKMVSSDGNTILSIIPGISLSRDGKEQHAFIQTIDGKTAQTEYYSFPIEQFSFSKSEFAIAIGPNYFSKDKIILNIQQDSTHLKGEVFLSNQMELSPRKFLNGGIMGWYRFVPFMQCYHGVVNLSNTLHGTITRNDTTYHFDQGIGYIEKDWGNSMPSSWIWMQSNNFYSGNSSFMLSIANIPWLGKSFTGFLGFFLHNGTIHRFATYTRAKLSMQISSNDTIHIQIKDKNYSYFIEAIRNNSGQLKAPVNGSMDRRIAESIDAQIKLTVYDNKAQLLYSDSSAISGLEIVGDTKLLTTKLKKKK